MSATVLLDVDQLRSAIQDEYTEVAACPLKGFHFHTGRFLAARLGYPEDRVVALPDAIVVSFAGVGNPFAWGEPVAGETVLDLGPAPASTSSRRRRWSVRPGARSGST